MAAVFRVRVIPPRESSTEQQSGHAPFLPWDDLYKGTDEP